MVLNTQWINYIDAIKENEEWNFDGIIVAACPHTHTHTQN
jgi:hypothetical protein